MDERKRFMNKISHQRSKNELPLYLKMQNEHELRNRQWYEQFSRKEIIKYSIDRTVSDEGFLNRKSASQKTFNLPSTSKLKLPINRYTETQMNTNIVKLDKVEEIEKINQKIKSEIIKDTPKRMLKLGSSNNIFDNNIDRMNQTPRLG